MVISCLSESLGQPPFRAAARRAIAARRARESLCDMGAGAFALALFLAGVVAAFLAGAFLAGLTAPPFFMPTDSSGFFLKTRF